MADLEVQYLQVQTTTDSRAEAMELSRAAVESRLAACAQVAGPVASMYWWDGALERAEEWLVLLKLPARHGSLHQRPRGHAVGEEIARLERVVLGLIGHLLSTRNQKAESRKQK